MRFFSIQKIWKLPIWILAVCGMSSCAMTSQYSQYIDKVDEDGTRVIRIEAARFEYKPSHIRVRQGERVRLIFTSQDTTHGVAIAEYHVRRDIPPRGKGETVVEFIAVKAGSFTFRCSHLCGAGHAMMRGTLVVESL